MLLQYFILVRVMQDTRLPTYHWNESGKILEDESDASHYRSALLCALCTWDFLASIIKFATQRIFNSEFPTTRLEMEKVADEFDKGDGMIDSKEFMAKLRSDFSKVFSYILHCFPNVSLWTFSVYSL